jgi:hypothetical protein
LQIAPWTGIGAHQAASSELWPDEFMEVAEKSALSVTVQLTGKLCVAARFRTHVELAGGFFLASAYMHSISFFASAAFLCGALATQPRWR